MKKILLTILFVLSFSAGFAQNKDAVIRDFLRSVGEADTTTGAVTGAIARTWMNEFFREASYYGAFMRETTYVAAAGRDSFPLPADFLFVQAVRKSIPNRGHDFPLSDSAPSFYERTDTIRQSVARPDTALAQDVVAIRSAYRKDLTSGTIKHLVQIQPESVSRVANTPSDYYYYNGQPYPKVTWGKKATFGDTIFAEVSAILPQYGVYVRDTSDVLAGLRQKFLTLFPPPVRADTLWVQYAGQMDTAAVAADSTRPITSVEISLRPAIGHYLKEQYYRKKGFFTEADYWMARWKTLLCSHAVARGIRIAPILCR